MSFHRSVRLARIFVPCMPVLFAWQLAGAGDPPTTGTIAVRQAVQCCYREGSVSYVAVRQVGSDLFSTKVLRPLAPSESTLLVETELTPGSYVISSFQRPCDGNCDVLNSPVDPCDSDPIELSAGTIVNVLVSVVPFGGCSISVVTDSM